MSEFYKMARDAFLNDPIGYDSHERPRWQRRLSWLVRKWQHPIYTFPDTIRMVMFDDHVDSDGRRWDEE